MARKRMTDEEIQAYLDSHPRRKNATVAAQIDSATEKEIAAYEALYVALGQNIPNELSAEFADSVLERIEHESGESLNSDLWQILLVFLSFAAAIGGTFFLGGFDFLTKINFNLNETGKSFTTLLNFFSELNLDLGLLGTGVVMLGIMSALDHLFSHSRRRLPSFFR